MKLDFLDRAVMEIYGERDAAIEERDHYRDAQRTGDVVINILLEALDEYVIDQFEMIPELEESLKAYNTAVTKILEVKR